MKGHRRTKIVATLGPATSSLDQLDSLFRAGVDVFRLNFSHGEAADHIMCAERVRRLEAQHQRPTCLLADLQGPKLRVGDLADDPVNLTSDGLFTLDLDPSPGSAERVCLPHPEIFQAVTPGDVLLVDDGKIRLQILRVEKDQIHTKVRVGGLLRSHKGVNLPGVRLAISALTGKDRADLESALELGADWIALSFVQRPEDVLELRALVGDRAGIMVKLEKPQALDDLQAIVEVCDAVMVARGDLGVELSAEDVPPAQKEIISACRVQGKPVIVATQMLESMIDNPTPTRAEASDVANAVYEGADAVMLSAETAIGSYPVEAVRVMDRIVSRMERVQGNQNSPQNPIGATDDKGTAAIVASIGLAAERASASCITSYTTSGATALRIANVRPTAPIIAMTPKVSTWRKLCVVWGVRPVHTDDAQSVTQMVDKAVQCARQEGMARHPDHIVISAGMPFGTPGATNLLRIAAIPKQADAALDAYAR